MTVEAIVEAPWAVALAVALAVVEVAPALQSGRAVLPGVVEVQRAVAAVPAAGVVVTQRVADVVPRPLVTLRNLAADLHFRGRRDVPAQAADKGIVQNVAQQAVEVAGTAAAEERHIWGDLACAAVVARVRYAQAVGGGLALGAGEGRRTEAARAEVAGHACASIPTVQAAAGAGIVLARGAGEALQGRKPVKLIGYTCGGDGRVSSGGRGGFTHRRTLADVTVRGVAGDGARASVPAGSPLAAVKHPVATLAWRRAREMSPSAFKMCTVEQRTPERGE